MRIAFDLDDTLIPGAFPFPTERPTLPARLLGGEPLRLGTVGLVRELRRRGCDVWVYTTSLRSPFSVRLLFLCYGLRLGGVVNADTRAHALRLRGQAPGPRHCSKYPPTFAIDLLVDDLEGVRLEGEQFGFRVLRVAPEDDGWAARVLAEVDRWCRSGFPA
jgi:hypothetical protein